MRLLTNLGLAAVGLAGVAAAVVALLLANRVAG